MGVLFLSRDDWGAGPLVAGAAAPHSQFLGLVIHHTVTTFNPGDDPAAHMRWLQKVRPDLGSEIPYSFVVFPTTDPESCVVAEGRGWGRTGAHTVGYNSTAYGVAFAGNFQNDTPTPGMLEGVRWIGRRLADPINALHTIGHLEVFGTACPGENTVPLLGKVQPPFTEPTEDDMPLSDDDVARIRDAVLDAPIATRRGTFPLRAVIGWTKDEVTEPDLLLARIDAADEPAGFVGEGASAKEVADELAARLSG